ncbi:MAG TPA: hypothetical protein VNH44_17695 [Micropepsaceae bacterium]|nr:hypothetical protein [Micropepsaceae bacterium]
MNEHASDTRNLASDDDIQALRAELKNLRADFVKIGELLKDTARNRGAEAADKLRATAERGWNDAKSTAQTVLEEMEERPLGTAAAVFVAGMLFGILLGGRR